MVTHSSVEIFESFRFHNNEFTEVSGMNRICNRLEGQREVFKHNKQKTIERKAESRKVESSNAESRKAESSIAKSSIAESRGSHEEEQMKDNEISRTERENAEQNNGGNQTVRKKKL